MRKMGDRREDGYVFLGYKKHVNGKTYESWTTLEKFLRIWGDDFFERREARIARKKAKNESRARWHDRAKHLAALTNGERVERDKELSKQRKASKLAVNPDYFREVGRKYREKKKNDAEFKRKQKEAAKRHYEKKYGPKREAKRLAREEKLRVLAGKKAVRERELADKKALKEVRRLEREANRKPPLTEEQRAENERNRKRNYKHRRRARLKNCEIRATPKMIQDARVSAGDRCYYCNVKADLTLDHFEPLAAGGAHCVSNFVFACRSCNSSKRDLDPFDFMASKIAIEIPYIGG